MEIVIRHADTDDEIAATFDVMLQLRPHLVREEYVPLVRSMERSDDYRLLYLLEDGIVRAAAGYRFMHTLYCARMLTLDDLVTDEQTRSHGHGSRMVDALKEIARAGDCAEIHLISRVTRDRAHQFYFREGFEMQCYHFAFRCD